jgi:hypothetical protein
VSGCKRLVRTAALLGVASCASAPPSHQLLEAARESYEAGRLESALRTTERAMQRDPSGDHAAEISLHLAILRDLGRHEEARAFSEFVARYAAGEDTDASETTPTRDECTRLERERSGSRSLIRRYGELRQHSDFEIGTVAAAYAIAGDGRPVDIRVLRARHPASAWLIIDSIAQARISTARLDAVEPEKFPVPHCAYWTFRSGARGSRTSPGFARSSLGTVRPSVERATSLSSGRCNG